MAIDNILKMKMVGYYGIVDYFHILGILCVTLINQLIERDEVGAEPKSLAISEKLYFPPLIGS